MFADKAYNFVACDLALDIKGGKNRALLLGINLILTKQKHF